jgi:transcription-repair coupling factor (superfamily II helicase)
MPGMTTRRTLCPVGLRAMSLRSLLDAAHEDERYRSLVARIGDGSAVARVSATLRPFLLATLLEDEAGLAGRAALLVAPDDRAARLLATELRAFLAPRRVRYYPSRGTGYASHVAPPPHLVGLRIDALDALRSEPEPVVVASAIALAEAVPDASLRPAGFAIDRGEELDLGAVADDLAGAGYERVEQVSERGQFALRGGILDVYPATEERAVRIELFGDEVESLRWFSTFTQRSLGDAERVELAPAAELAPQHRELAEAAAAEAREGGEVPDLADVVPIDSFHAPMELVPDGAAVVLAGDDEIEPALRDHWEDVTTAMHAADAQRLYVEVAGPLGERASLVITGTGPEDEDAFRAARAESPARSVREAEAEVEKLTRSGYRVVVAFDRRGEAERARYNLERLDARILDGGPLPEDAALLLAEAPLRDGFVSPELRLAVFPFRRLVHRRRVAPSRPGRRARLAFSDLRVGDFVVHEDHGVARFAGFETREVGGVTRDYLYLEYRGEDRVYVPTDQLAKLSRYVGAGAEPALSALGGKRWENMKARARRAASALAGELLNLYAERRTRKGHAFPPDSEWQIAFEQAFPYRETADQLDAIEAVKADMEAERPMDRLVCGDVGYGKTEVALRAAVKAASDGKQVMMLAPTTILAQQHFGTFGERLADLPFIVEVVSRLRKPAETKAVLRDFGAGKVDILIGTHRLLSRDVRAKDLGLLIVDEEQRFGVKQKELLRQLKLKVDVLSLSATPIPRTLQMSLAGLRDISVIETPPEGRRPIRTYVGPWDEDLVKRAIEREVDRGGQAFFLHNRIETLSEVAERLRALVPGARFIEAHGRMEESELEDSMLRFLRGDGDCLVATTIIESGLDIPSANTLIAERADQLGLAQAYQIRGRVGRSRDRAFAYLLYPSPAALTPEAGARLATLSDHTELGSGFRIAMRDLDIRGAGNLLGDEQSGHVAAVGFELYCQMIDEAVESMAEDGDRPAPEPLRFDVPVDAYLPPDYVPFEAAKIDLHRRIAASREPAELREIRDELEDRFGPPPAEAGNLLELQRARIELAAAGASRVEFRGGRLSVVGVELDSEQVDVLRERIEGVVYEWRERVVALRVPDQPEARLGAVVALAAALGEVRRAVPAPA